MRLMLMMMMMIQRRRISVQSTTLYRRHYGTFYWALGFLFLLGTLQGTMGQGQPTQPVPAPTTTTQSPVGDSIAPAAPVGTLSPSSVQTDVSSSIPTPSAGPASTVQPVTQGPATSSPGTETPTTTSPITTSPVAISPVTTSPVTTSPVTTSPVTTSPATTSPPTTASGTTPTPSAPTAPSPATPTLAPSPPLDPSSSASPTTAKPAISTSPVSTPPPASTLNPSASTTTLTPSVQQTAKQTESPTVPPQPTIAPSVTATTASPVTPSPTLNPTTLPVTDQPSPSPSVATGNPTVTTEFPSSSPTVQPVTNQPSLKPSFKPSRRPTFVPTKKATEQPTLTPTDEPSHNPSDKPTHAGSTRKPSFPSSVPSFFPSEAPSFLTDSPLYEGLNITLRGLSSFSGGAQSTWISVTQKYIMNYFKSRPGLQVTVNHVVVTVKSSTVEFSRRRRGTASSRGLQSGTPSVVVTYNQEFGYKSVNRDISTDYIVRQPFSDPTSTAYKDLLVEANPSAFSALESTSAVTIPGSNIDKIVSGSNKSKGLSETVIIVIAAGGGLLGFALLVALFYYMSSQRGRRLRQGYLNKKDNEDSPPTQLQLGAGADEVSTLAEPQTQTRIGRGAHESIAGYGDQSVTTVDYDYSKAYGGAGDTSVSSAGGTFGSNTQGNVEVTAAAAAAGAALGGSFSDQDSFDANYREPGANIKEELIDVYAPPGKLGVVIDTPDDGAPVVHAIKDSSVIADKLQVGDKLVAVDDEDVRSMTAIKVSKLISRKSSNPTRKLSIVRTTIVE